MVSVVVLSETIPENLLENLSGQTYKDFEIVHAREKGISLALNNALNKAKGDIFIRIDDDVIIPPMWIEKIVKNFSDPKVGGVTGPTHVPSTSRQNRDSIRLAENPNWFLNWMFDGDPFAPAKIYKCGSVSYGSNFIEKLNLFKEYEIDHLEGTNWAVRTELIRKVGGFDPAFKGVSEWIDTDVVFKIKKLGYKLVYDQNAYIWHILSRGHHYDDRFEGWSRMKNWLRFHARHSKFHPKMIIWFLMMGTYFVTNYFRKFVRR